jgi:hypothetical protein
LSEKRHEYKKVTGDKKEYRDLLLLLGEQESTVDENLEHDEMFVLDDSRVKAG